MKPWIEHPGEDASNRARQRLAASEPLSLRTFTPSLAILERSAGSYHWTSEGRRLADFTSGVLVANLGHNPRRWWERFLRYLEVKEVPSGDGFREAVPLTAYNAATPVEVSATERLLASLRRAPG